MRDYESASAAPEDSKTLYDIDLEVLGDRIRRARLRLKLSQREVSSELFTSAYLSSLELGKTRPAYKTLVRLAERLNKTPAFFLGQGNERGNGNGSGGEDAELNEEQTHTLKVRLALLTAQTALAQHDVKRTEAALTQVKLDLSHLPHAERADYYYLRGQFQSLRSEPTEAITEFEEAQKYLKPNSKLNSKSNEGQGSDPTLEILIEMGLGLAHYAQRRIMPALSHFVAVAEYIRNRRNNNSSSQSPDSLFHPLLWKVLVNIGQCYLSLNDWQQAMEAYEQALEAAKEGQVIDLKAQANLHYELAQLYAKQGDYERACLNLGRCQQIYAHIENQTLLVTTHNHLAQLYTQTEQFGKAEGQISEALRLVQLVEGNSRDEAPSRNQHRQCVEMNALVTLAVLQRKQHHTEQAQTFIAQAIELSSNCSDTLQLSQLYRVAGELAGDGNDRVTAQAYFEQALSVLENTATATTQGNSGQALAEVYHSYGQHLRVWGDLDRAFEFLDKAYRQRKLVTAS